MVFWLYHKEPFNRLYIFLIQKIKVKNLQSKPLTGGIFWVFIYLRTQTIFKT